MKVILYIGSRCVVEEMRAIPRVGEYMYVTEGERDRQVLRVTWFKGNGDKKNHGITGWYPVVML